MRRLAHIRHTVLLIAAFAISGAQSATEPLSNVEVGRRYLDAFYAFDFLELEVFLHADAIFEDPTSEVVSPGVTWRFTDRSAILDFVRQTSASIVDAEYRVLSEFSTGEFVVFNMEYSTVFDGEMLGTPGQEFSVELPAVTILRIQDGLVNRYTGHVDYAFMLEQVTKQSKE